MTELSKRGKRSLGLWDASSSLVGLRIIPFPSIRASLEPDALSQSMQLLKFWTQGSTVSTYPSSEEAVAASCLPLWAFWGRSTAFAAREPFSEHPVQLDYVVIRCHRRPLRHISRALGWTSQQIQPGKPAQKNSAQQSLLRETTLLRDLSRLGVCHLCPCEEPVWHASNHSGVLVAFSYI